MRYQSSFEKEIYQCLSHMFGVYYLCDKPLLYQILLVRTIFDTAPRFNASVT